MKSDIEFMKLYLGLECMGPMFESEKIYNCDRIYEEREKRSKKAKTNHFLLQLFRLLFHKIRRR